MRRLLEQYESDTIASELTTTSDVGLFLDFALRVRCFVDQFYFLNALPLLATP